MASHKVPGNRKLIGSKSEYYFMLYAGTEEVKSYDRIDFGMFGRSWAPIVSWAVIVVPHEPESNWRKNLPPPSVNNMDPASSLCVIASGSSNGYKPIGDDKKDRPFHGVRTTVPLNKLQYDREVLRGGSLVLEINLLEVFHGGDVVDSDHTFDGQVFWNLYSN